MQLLKKGFDFYVFSNIHVALAAFCLTKTTAIYYGVESNNFSLLVFFATVVSYNFIRFYRKLEIKSWMHNWISSNKLLLYVLSGASLMLLIWFGLKLQKHTLFALLPMGILTLFYVVPFRGNLSLRIVSGLKLFLIAFCWAFVTVFLPLLDADISINLDIWITFLQRFFFVVAITLPFDIRDLQYDSLSLKTMPQVFGEAKAKRIGILFLMLFVGFNFFKENTSQFLRTEFVVMLISLLLLVRSTSNQHKYYSAFFVEAIPIVWFLLLLL